METISLDQPPEARRTAIRGTPVTQALLWSELTTVELGVWAQAHFLADGAISWVVALTAGALALVVFGLDWSIRTRFPAVPRLVGIVLIAAVVGLTGGQAGWAKVGAGAASLAVALAVIRRLMLTSARLRPLTPADGLRGALLQLVAAWALHPYVVSGMVGSGDAYHYGLMVADMIGQLRAHVFPIFVGQTEFGLNGNIHTLRTAPYYVHLGAALDLLTFRILPIFAVQHLTLLVTAALGSVGAYAALRRFRPEAPWICAALAALYILSPGVLTPLYEGDMIATFMAVAMIPWLFLGLAQAAELPRAWKPWVIQACALGGLWWAHPPVAFWCTLIVLGQWLALLLIPGRSGFVLLRIGAAAAVFLAVTTFVFVSVYSLRLRPPEGIDGAGYAAAIVANLKGALPASFLPLTGAGTSALGDLQLGYSLLAAAVIGVAAAGRSLATRFLLGSAALLLLLLLPVSGLGPRLWSLFPAPVLTVTNVWPMQRLYLPLAGLAIFLGAGGLAVLAPAGPRARLALALGLAVALGWSGREAEKLFARAAAITTTAAAAAQSLTPEDLTLTRSSYLVFNFFPPYFSHAPVDPALESRLYDPDTDRYFGSGATATAGADGGNATTIDLVRTAPDWVMTPTLTVPPHRRLLLRFDFLGQQPAGTLQFLSPTMSREYLLPSSGESRSFGAGADNGRLITLVNSGDAPEEVEAQFIPTGAPPAGAPPRRQTFARVTLEPLDARPRMVEIESLVPYVARVNSPRPALLETPRVFVPGYAATVDGRPGRVLQTNDGLSAVYVPAGRSEVRLGYPGDPLLRATYWMGLASWLAMLAWVLLPAGWENGLHRLLRGHDLQRRTLRLVPWLALPLIGAAGLVLLAWTLNQAALSARRGAIRIEFLLPMGALQGAQPLLCTGKTGAADVIYVRFLDGGRLQVGDDHWGRGGTLSAPFPVDWTAPQRVEISMSSLLAAPAAGAPPPPLAVRWNGRLVLTDEVQAYPTTAQEIVVGANPAGSSTCAPTFTGSILDVVRIRDPLPLAVTAPR